MASPLLNAVSAIGRRIAESYRATDTPGPEIQVSPFRPGEVTGEGIALKSLTALVAGRRAAANFRLKREKQEADLAHREALTRQIEAKLAQPTTTYHEIDVDGTPVRVSGAQLAAISARRATNKRLTDAHTDLQNRRKQQQDNFERQMEFRREQETRRQGATKRYAAAGASLKDLDAEAARYGDLQALAAERKRDFLLKIVAGEQYTPEQKKEAATALGLSPQMLNGKPVRGPRGGPVYDLAANKGALEALVERARRRGIIFTRANQKDRRAALERVRETEALNLRTPGVEPLDQPIDPDAPAMEDPSLPSDAELDRMEESEADPLDPLRQLFELYLQSGE